MSNIIESISFQNFYNYYGSYDQNTYFFKPGLNLIVADNGGGKSKLFNGILWVLEKEVLDSDTKKPKKIGHAKFQVISDKAKKDAELDEEIVTGVKIEYSDSNFRYQIINEIRAIKRRDGNPTDQDNWETYLSEVKINRKDLQLIDYRPVFDKEEQLKIINNMLRREFREYALLQGEEVDNIINLTDSHSLAKAIESLSNIRTIDDLGELSNYLLKRASKDLDTQRSDATLNKNRYNFLIGERTKIEDKINKINQLLENAGHNLTKAESDREKFLNDQANAKERQGIRELLKTKEQEYKQLDDGHVQFLDNINKYFFDDRFAWLLLETNDIRKLFEIKRDKYIDNRESIRVEHKVKSDPESYIKYLAENVPDISSLEKMLQKKVCFVCGRKADEESEAWVHIKNVMERPSSNANHKAVFKNDLSKLFDDLKTNTRSLITKIDKITETVKVKRKELNEIIEKKNELAESIELLKNELLGKGGVEVGGDQDINVLQAFENITNRIQKYKHEIKDESHSRVRLEKELKERKAELENLNEQPVPESYIKNYEVLETLNNAILKTKETVLDRMITKLESEANKHFKNLIKHTGIVGSKLIFMRTADRTVRMRVQDSDGNLVTGESEGFQRMKKLAVVMAIITASTKGMSNYPFIADAPISAFGKGFIKGFFEEVPNVFNQSIIMVKELYDIKTETNLTEFGYELYERKIPATLYVNEVERELEQINRKTIIHKYI